MNLGEMKTLMGLYVDDPNGTKWTDAYKVILLNQSQAWLVAKIESVDDDYFLTSDDVSVTATTDNSDFTDTLPADYRTSVAFEKLSSNERPVVLGVVTHRCRDDYISQLDDSDKFMQPYVFVYGTTLGVVNPSEAFTLRHWYLPRLDDMTLDADESDVPAEYHDIIVKRAAYNAMFAERGDMSVADRLKQEYMEGLSEMRSELKTQFQQHREVKEYY